jgi:hypothetical protein
MRTILLLLAACQSPALLSAPQAPPPATLSLDLPALAALEPATLTVSGAAAGAEVVVFVSTTDSGRLACPRAMRPACLDLYAPASVIASGRANADGVFQQRFEVPLTLLHEVVYAQAVARAGRTGAVSPVEREEVVPSWCYSDEGCDASEHCTVSDGACNSDPSCPMCDVCTGTCVDDAPVCASSNECPAGLACSTEWGDCDSPPGCVPGEPCITLCYGVCEVPPTPFCYGDDGCGAGQHCTVSDGVCDPDPTCPACAVCTGTCVDDAIWCASTQSCPAGTVCSTEQGECLSPPGCNAPGVACPDVCYGTCGGGMAR